MPKTTEEIIDWWDEGDNDDGHKNKCKWYSEEEVIKVWNELEEYHEVIINLRKEVIVLKEEIENQKMKRK